MLFAQKGTITGTIINEKNQQPIPFASISCIDLQGTIISGVISNENGTFLIEKLPLKELKISIQFIGYKTETKKIPFSKNNSNIDIGIIPLVESSDTLKDVEVQAETSSIVQKIDRKIITVGKDLTAAGTNAFDMFENIPSVSVNRTSGTVSLRGNSNVHILVNEKPSNLSNEQLLKQIRSNTIEKIEIITNPSAKYSPEGMSGLINIVLKKNAQIGFNGSVSAGAEHSKNTRPDAYLNLNYKTGAVNFYGDYSTNFGDYETIFDYNRTDIDLFQHLDFLNNENAHNFKLGADISLSKKHSLSLFTSQNIDIRTLKTTTEIFENNILDVHTDYFSEYDLYDQTYNIDYIYSFNDKEEQLEIEFNYNVTKNPELAESTDFINGSSSILNFNSDIEDTRTLHLFNIDYTKPLTAGKLELGLEFRQQVFENLINTNQIIETGSGLESVGNSDVNYKRTMYSGYVNYKTTIKKFAFQTGMRIEQFILDAYFNNTTQGNTIVEDEIFTLYPSVFVSYEMNDKNSFQMSYSRRVDRPSSYHVSPILEWSSPLSISTGNINLRPEFTNSFELNYTRNYKGGFASFGTFYRRTSDKIGLLIGADEANPNRQIRSFTNYDFADSYGFEVAARCKPLKLWTMTPSFEVYIQDSQGLINDELEDITNTQLKARLGNSFKVSKILNVQVSAIHRGKGQSIQHTVDPYTYFNAGAQLAVLNGDGTINFRATDIFNALDFTLVSENPFSQTTAYTLEMDAIYLGFTYSFGSGKNKAKERRNRDNNEAQKTLFLSI